MSNKQDFTDTREYNSKINKSENTKLHILVAQQHKEIQMLKQLRDEVLKVWNEDGDGGEIQMKTPIAWYRVINIAEKLEK